MITAITVALWAYSSKSGDIEESRGVIILCQISLALSLLTDLLLVLLLICLIY